MKKINVFICLVLVVVCVSACAHGPAAPFSGSSSPVIDRVLKRGQLIVGTAATMPPFTMTTKGGSIIGLDIDIATYIADAMGVELKLETLPFSDLLPALEAGTVDMVISGMTITPERNLKVAFVGPYFISGKGVLTKTRTIAAIKDGTEINNPDTTLVVLRGSTSQKFVEAVMPDARLYAVGSYDEAVDMVRNDKVHAMVADYPVCVISVYRYPESGLLSVITPLTYEPLGIALSGSDPHFINWLENLLTTLAGVGELENLHDKWFENGDWLKKLP
jgi:polar amino acid transport system substrate-binding protein